MSGHLHDGLVFDAVVVGGGGRGGTAGGVALFAGLAVSLGLWEVESLLLGLPWPAVCREVGADSSVL